MSKKTAILIDLDGVLRQDETLLPHAVDFLRFLKEKEVPFCILSNTTRYPATKVQAFFTAQDNTLKDLTVLTALDTTAEYVMNKYTSYAVYCEERAKVVFDKIDDSMKPEVVVTGDLGSGWTFEVLNKIFNQLRNGADLVAMQMNKFGKNTNGDLELDAGAFVTALEYASEKKATLIGKPSSIFFKTGLKKTGVANPERFFMLGDDLNADIKTPMDMGGTSILMLTGKTSQATALSSNISPDFMAKDLTEAMDILKKEGI